VCRLAGILQPLLVRPTLEAVPRAARGGDFPLTTAGMRWQINFMSVPGL